MKECAAPDLPLHVLDDDADVGLALRLLLRRRFGAVQVHQRPASLLQALAQGPGGGVVLLDMNHSPGRSDGEQGLALISTLQQLTQPPRIIALTAYGAIELAVRALQAGAVDFITKPWDTTRLLAAVQAALAGQAAASSGAQEVDGLIGQSSAMVDLRRTLAAVAPTEANVLILGEMGVGKELVAQALHRQSARAARGSFHPIDLGSLADSTLQSELFGHRRGSFTDAREHRAGRLAAAGQGTLLLDEIGNLSLNSQATLLAVLERREFTPLGADQAQPLLARVLSATNLDDAALHDPQRFRPDLLHRLNTLVLRVPPLRQRREDIALITTHYLARYAAQYGKAPRPLAPDALQALQAHDWPGNVRALRHACERAVILGQGAQWRVQDFQLTATPKACEPSPAAAPQTLAEQERAALHSALARARGNLSEVARQLGLSRAALYRRLDKHGL
ncbi:sigma-54-dependent transcriptional regulator [Roseateles sp. BYS180W]|uniref:Sigma-54-dependent transcriptional regulator n=1 Tax=Roseateles rivi TaxID=3299028 RepID=A0ABW7FU68_9BURK